MRTAIRPSLSPWVAKETSACLMRWRMGAGIRPRILPARGRIREKGRGKAHGKR